MMKAIPMLRAIRPAQNGIIILVTPMTTRVNNHFFGKVKLRFGKCLPMALSFVVTASPLFADYSISSFSLEPTGLVFQVSATTNQVFPSATIDCYHARSLTSGGWWWIDSAEVPNGTNSFSLFVSADKFLPADEGLTEHGISCAAVTNIYPCPLFTGVEVTNVTWNCTCPAWPTTAFFRLGDRTDTDGDGLVDSYEHIVMGTDLSNPDTDHDAIWDYDEALFGLNPTNYYDTIEDFDGDGLPNVFEYFNGTNPFIADYDDAPRIIAGTNAAQGELSLSNAFASSTPYSIIELRPGHYAGPEWTGLTFPPHPILLTSTNGFNNHDTTIGAPTTENFVFSFEDAQDLHTIVQGLTVDLRKETTSLLSAFKLSPAEQNGSGAYFKNIHVRLSNKGVGRGWWIVGPSSNSVMIANSLVEYVPSRNGQAVYATDPPPIFIDGLTAFNSGGRSASRALYLRRTSQGIGLFPFAVKNSLFDETFGTNRIVYISGAEFPESFINCVVPDGANLHTTNETGVVRGNVTVLSDGMPAESSLALGAGASYSFVTADIEGFERGTPPDIGAYERRNHANDGRDSDGDGLANYDEVSIYSTSPWFADTDCDGIDDGIEVSHGANPTDAGDYCFSLSVVVTNTSIFKRDLSLGIRPTSVSSNEGVIAVAVATNYPIAQFAPCHVIVTNSAAQTAIVFDDANTNGVFDAEDVILSSKAVTLTNHSAQLSFSLGTLAFDKDNDGIPSWWEAQYGLSDTNSLDAVQDPDGDFLPNLQEYIMDYDPTVPDGSNTIFAVASRSIDERIAGKNPTNALPVFLNYPACGTNLVRNTDCWAYGVDTSCASPWHSLTPRTVEYKNTVTLISPRHFVTASHYDPSLFNNTVLYFVGQDNAVYANRYAGYIDIGNDIRIGKLAWEMTNMVSVAKILPANYANYLPNVDGLPVFTFDQEEKALVCELQSIGADNINMKTYLTSGRSAFHEAAVDGDSSSPWFVLLNEQPVLLTTYHGSTYGPWLANYHEEIQAAMDALAPGYTLQEADLTEYDPIVIQGVNQ